MDADQTFTTGAVPNSAIASSNSDYDAGMTPQSGVELLDLVNGKPRLLPWLVTDLNGNVLWSYHPVLPRWGCC